MASVKSVKSVVKFFKDISAFPVHSCRDGGCFPNFSVFVNTSFSILL